MVSSRGLPFQDSVIHWIEHLDNEMATEEMSYPSKLASRVVEVDEGEAGAIMYP